MYSYVYIPFILSTYLHQHNSCSRGYNDAIVMLFILFCEIHQLMRGISKPNTLVVAQLLSSVVICFGIYSVTTKKVSGDDVIKGFL